MEAGGIAADGLEVCSEKQSFSANRASETQWEIIAAKDAAIAAQDKLIDQLNIKKRSIWSRIADIAIGVAAVSILR